MRITRFGSILALALVAAAGGAAAPSEEARALRATQAPTDLDIDALKREVLIDVDSRRDFTRQMVDMIFSFGELGFQEVETSRVITGAARSRWPRRSRTRERR